MLSILPVASLLLAASVVGGCSDRGGSAGENRGASEAIAVRVEKATQRDLERVITVFGSFLAREEATISTKVQGRLAEALVDMGSAVSAGAEVAIIESREFELRVRQAEAALAQARARLGLAADDETTVVDPEVTSVVRQAAAVLREARANRNRLTQLQKDGVLSQAELETAEAGFTIAENRFQDALEDVRQRIALVTQRQAERDMAIQQLTDTRLLAPFDAVVQERLASPGELLRVGDPLMTLVAMDPLRFRLEVSERDAPLVKIGQQVRVHIEGLTDQFEGGIVRVSPAIDQQRRVLIVEVDIANEGSLHPGMFARADVVVAESDPALTVPTDAVVRFAGIEKVFTVEDGKAVERVVTTGRVSGSLVEVTGDLRVGETVILDPGKLQNDQPVRVETGTQTAAAPPAS